MTSLTAQMTPSRNLRSVQQSLILLLIAFYISGCDGGLFGTGDGTETLDINTPPTADGTGAEGGAEGAGGAIENPPESTPAPDTTPEDSGVTIEFENLEPSGLATPTPLLTLINPGTTDISVAINAADAQSVVNVASGEKVSSIALSLMDNTVTISNTVASTLATISPLTTASSTLTTIVVRDPVTVDASTASQNDSSSILITSTRARSTAPELSLIRLIQVAPLDSTNQSATFTLSPDIMNPGTSEIVFNNVDALRNPVTSYQLTGAGQYLLNDSLNRFPPIVVLLESNEVYTLLLNNLTNPSVQVVEDSDISVP